MAPWRFSARPSGIVLSRPCWRRSGESPSRTASRGGREWCARWRRPSARPASSAWPDQHVLEIKLGSFSMRISGDPSGAGRTRQSGRIARFVGTGALRPAIIMVGPAGKPRLHGGGCRAGHSKEAEPLFRSEPAQPIVLARILSFVSFHPNGKRASDGTMIEITRSISIPRASSNSPSSARPARAAERQQGRDRLRAALRRAPLALAARRHRGEADETRGPALTKDGVVVISADRHRSQEMNRADALERITAMIPRGGPAAAAEAPPHEATKVRSSAG